MKSNLEICRICNTDAKRGIVKHHLARYILPRYSVKCTNCGAETPLLKTRARAIDYWNKHNKEVENTRKELEALKKECCDKDFKKIMLENMNNCCCGPRKGGNK